MLTRVVTIVIAVLTIGGLIIYSKLKPERNCVSGIVEADEIRVGSRIGGRVNNVLVKEGDPVEKGQVLIELEPFDLNQREQEAVQKLAALESEVQKLQTGLRPEEIAQAKARYEQSQARLDLLIAGPREQAIEAARNQEKAVQVQLRLAEQNRDRGKELLQTNAISEEEYDLLIERVDYAKAQLLVRENELKLLELGTRNEEIREARAKTEEAKLAWELAKQGVRKEDVNRAKAERDAAKAALDAIREQKKELTVRSPVDGTVEALDLQSGDLVAPSAPILSIMDDKQMWIRTYIPQNRVGLSVGQKLQITAESLNEESFQGEISYISRQAEFTPSNVQTPKERTKQVFRMKVTIEDPNKVLRPGMTVDVWLDPVRSDS